MSLEQLVIELRKLNCADKLRAMQVLVAGLAAEEIRLQVLLDGVTEENRHGETNTGPDIGNEIV